MRSSDNALDYDKYDIRAHKSHSVKRMQKNDFYPSAVATQPQWPNKRSIVSINGLKPSALLLSSNFTSVSQLDMNEWMNEWAERFNNELPVRL